ncbi:MAG: hypothetical protein AAGA81_00975 [Acidobacteriota bacterium]
MTETDRREGRELNSEARPRTGHRAPRSAFVCRHRRVLALAVLLSALICAGGAAVTLAGSLGYRPPESRLVRVILEVSGAEAVERTYQALITTDGQPLEWSSKRRLPVATAVGDGPAALEYLAVGLSASLRVTAREDGRLRVEGRLGESRVAEDSVEATPKIDEGTHQFRGIFEPNSELELLTLTDSSESPYRVLVQVAEL